REVHLRDPRREHVGRVAAPLRAQAGAQLVERDVVEEGGGRRGGHAPPTLVALRGAERLLALGLLGGGPFGPPAGPEHRERRERRRSALVAAPPEAAQVARVADEQAGREARPA